MAAYTCSDILPGVHSEFPSQADTLSWTNKSCTSDNLNQLKMRYLEKFDLKIAKSGMKRGCRELRDVAPNRADPGAKLSEVLPYAFDNGHLSNLSLLYKVIR